MALRLIISAVFILLSTIPIFGNEFRIIKGKVIDDTGEIMIGAEIQEYNNELNAVISDANGEFEIIIPNKRSIIRVIYGCSSFYEVLQEVKPNETYVIIQSYTKKTDKKTKRLKKKFKSNQKENPYFLIRYEEGLKPKTDIKTQILQYQLLFIDWDNSKIIAFQESSESGHKLLDIVEKELLCSYPNLQLEREVIINKEKNLARKIVKVEFQSNP